MPDFLGSRLKVLDRVDPHIVALLCASATYARRSRWGHEDRPARHDPLQSGFVDPFESMEKYLERLRESANSV